MATLGGLKRGRPPGKGDLDPARRLMRDSLIGLRLGQGATPEQVSQELGGEIAPRTVREIGRQVAEHSTNLLVQDPLNVVAAVLAEHERNLEGYTVLAAHTAHDNVYLGALKGRAGALASILELLQHTGRLPKNLGALAGVFQARALAVRMVDVMYDLIEERLSPQEALAAFEELVEFGADLPERRDPLLASPGSSRE